MLREVLYSGCEESHEAEILLEAGVQKGEQGGKPGGMG
jgi:hypothetical protein